MKKVFASALAILLVAGLAFADDAQGPIDLSPYPALNAKQIDLIRRLEKRGLERQTILNLIQVMLKPQPKGPEIPPYLPGDIEAVTRWGVGGAFASFARDAKVNFDRDAYLADCPNLPLFGFGKATATQYLHADVLQDFVNYVFILNRHLGDQSRPFRDAYMDEIRQTEFAKYVTIPADETQK